MTALLSSPTAAQPTSIRPLPPPTGPAHATLRLPLWARSLIVVAALDVGEATAKTHVSHVLAKLGVRDRVQR